MEHVIETVYELGGTVYMEDRIFSIILPNNLTHEALFHFAMYLGFHNGSDSLDSKIYFDQSKMKFLDNGEIIINAEI